MNARYDPKRAKDRGDRFGRLRKLTNAGSAKARRKLQVPQRKPLALRGSCRANQGGGAGESEGIATRK